jgi:ATP-dependent RNA helicase DDX54/DBP10
MPHRASSPALSENEFDITEALFKDEDQLSGHEDDQGNARSKSRKRPQEDAQHIALALEDSSNDTDDELFIAAQQAASNRKSSNVKGRSVKKGGGFQAMGRLPSVVQ